jgi:polar amino acid transport system substrate-binding protein
MTIKKSILFVIAAAFILLVQGVCFAKQQVVIVGDTSYPPYSYLEAGQPKGIYVDILKSAFSRMPDYEIEIKMLPWKNGMNSVKTGKNVGIFPPYYTEERIPWMLFSEPILKEEVVVFGKAENLEGKTQWPEDFFGNKFGVNQGFSPSSMGGDKFASAVKSGQIKLEEVGSNDQNLKKLKAGRIDFYLNDKMIDTSKFSSIKRGIVANLNNGYLGFTKKDENFKFIPDFKKQFDEIIKQMKESKEIDNIVQKYLQ